MRGLGVLVIRPAVRSLPRESPSRRVVDVCRWDHSSTPEGDGPPVVDVGAEEGRSRFVEEV